KTSVAWEDIELRVLLCYVGDRAATKTTAAARGSDYQARVMRRCGKSSEVVGPNARAILFGYHPELAGGAAAYTQMARELIEWGAAKGVRVAIYANSGSPMHAALGHPPEVEASELTFEGEK